MVRRAPFGTQVHGCLDELTELLAVLGLRRTCGDRIVFLGDVIGKGPHPVDALRLVRRTIDELGRGSELLIGNHEAALLKLIRARARGLPTQFFNKMASWSAAHRANYATRVRFASNLSSEEVAWLQRRPLKLYLPLPHRAAPYLAVHAGLQVCTGERGYPP